jgi:hypothetical protein
MLLCASDGICTRIFFCGPSDSVCPTSPLGNVNWFGAGLVRYRMFFPIITGALSVLVQVPEYEYVYLKCINKGDVLTPPPT